MIKPMNEGYEKHHWYDDENGKAYKKNWFGEFVIDRSIRIKRSTKKRMTQSTSEAFLDVCLNTVDEGWLWWFWKLGGFIALDTEDSRKPIVKEWKPLLKYWKKYRKDNGLSLEFQYDWADKIKNMKEAN